MTVELSLKYICNLKVTIDINHLATKFRNNLHIQTGVIIGKYTFLFNFDL